MLLTAFPLTGIISFAESGEGTVTGWQKTDGKWYYFEKTNGVMLRLDELEEGGKIYKLDSNGVCTNP